MLDMIELRGGGAPENSSLRGKETGFTLAEVLITIGIIGVVAAMTLPALINNNRNKALETAFKKNYSAISQALNMYYAQNGERLTPEYIGFHKLKPVLTKYMNVLHDCGFGHSDEDSACIPYSSDSTKSSNVYKNFNGTNTIVLSLFDDGQFILNDGSLILLENTGGTTLIISVDVNGYLKNPNRLGQDLFMFQIDNKGNLLPMGAEGTDYYDENDAYCSKTSTSTKNGAGCTIKAINEKDYFTKLH